jgi:predicted O-linked N-acetylglucosamine transferase (SPINDLY family)
MLLFARKPAPIQVTWLGFPATSGVKTIDYRITDHYADPEGMTEHLNVETLWRLPGMFCCYKAHENSPAPIDHPPSEDNGYVTFGCFNNFARVSDGTLDSWAKILARVPDARLLLEIVGIENASFKSDIEKRLVSRGLPIERVILEARKRENQYVLYNRIDIALDPFPSNGGTTSMDTLWMGVPLITKAGDQFFARLGTTILGHAGLPELIAQTPDEYVDLAVNLATDRSRLRNLRHRLRERVAATPLMDDKAFARNMEDAYRSMWRMWCSRRAGDA